MWLGLTLLGAALASFRIRPRTDSPVPFPGAVAVTNDGRPVYPVVGYSADGQPITADQVSGPVAGYNTRTNGMVIAAFILSFVFAPLAIPFGHVARAQIRRSGEQGAGLALAALIIAYCWLAVAVALLIMLFGH